MIEVEQNRSEPGRVTIRLVGEIGGPGARTLREALSDAAAPIVVIDLTNALFVDHGVIGAIATAARRSAAEGSRAWVVCPRQGMLHVLKEARILDAVEVVGTEAEVPSLAIP